MKKLLRVGLWLVLCILGLAAAGVIAAYFAMRASLPQLDGEIKTAGFNAPVTATRD